MVADSRMKHNSETILDVVRALVCFILFFTFLLYDKYPLYVTSAQTTTKDTLYII